MRSVGLWPAYLSQILSTGLGIQSLMLSWYSDQEHETGSASLRWLSMAYSFRVSSLWCTFVVTMVPVRQRKMAGESGERDLVEDSLGSLLQLSVAQRNGARWLLTCVWFLKWLFLLGLEILCLHLPAPNVPVLQLRETNSPSCVVNTHSF